MRSESYSPLLRRVILPLTLFLVIVAGIEAYVHVKFHPRFWEKTLWLLHDPFRGEPFDRMVTYIKLRHLEDLDPDIVSVGDSSGFFSVQPNIVQRYLGGKTYLNLSTGANQAFDGYYGIAEYMLRRSKRLKTVVLHMQSTLLPSDAVFKKADLAPIVRRNLVGRYADLIPPSAALSYVTKEQAFEWRTVRPGDPMLNHMVALEFEAIVALTRGWEPEHDVRFDRVGGKQRFFPDQLGDWRAQLGLTEPSAIKKTLAEFAQMVRSYGATLVIVFLPMADTNVRPNQNADIAQIRLQEFSRANPDVRFLMPLIETFGAEKFGGYNHISREYTNLSSKRLGLALRDYLDHPDEQRLFRPAPIPYFGHEVVVESISPLADLDPRAAVDAAMALYMYTVTADEKYAALMSNRVIQELGQEDSFSPMIAETRGRNAELAGRGISTHVDVAGLSASPVRVQGVRYCGKGEPTWVHVAGTIGFRYTQLPSLDTVEPVFWPKASHILIPLIREDGKWKFDGYCAEASVTVARR